MNAPVRAGGAVAEQVVADPRQLGHDHADIAAGRQLQAHQALPSEDKKGKRTLTDKELVQVWRSANDSSEP